MNAWFYAMCVMFVIRILYAIYGIGKGEVDTGLCGSYLRVGRRLMFRTIFDSILFFGSMGFFSTTM